MEDTLVPCLAPALALYQERREIELHGGYKAFKAAVDKTNAEYPALLSGMTR